MIRLFVNATVLTMDATLPVAQALAVKDGRIVEVGGTDEVLWLREDDYEVIDLEGRTIVPGFVDPHNHFSIGAFDTLWADCRGARSVADVQAALAAAARETPDGAWVRVVGYDHQALGVHPARGSVRVHSSVAVNAARTWNASFCARRVVIPLELAMPASQTSCILVEAGRRR